MGDRAEDYLTNDEQGAAVAARNHAFKLVPSYLGRSGMTPEERSRQIGERLDQTTPKPQEGPSS